MSSCSSQPIYEWTKDQAVSCSKENRKSLIIFTISVFVFFSILLVISLMGKKKEEVDEEERENLKPSSYGWIVFCFISFFFIVVVFYNLPSKYYEWEYWQKVKKTTPKEEIPSLYERQYELITLDP